MDEDRRPTADKIAIWVIWVIGILIALAILVLVIFRLTFRVDFV
jgi:uncharacterized integral membrane protein